MRSILRATTTAEFDLVRDLIAEYREWDQAAALALGFALDEMTYQWGPDDDEIPGAFVPPQGHLALAVYDSEPVGCGAFKQIDTQACELKRLYVRPGHRGLQIGRKLASHLIDQARSSGYTVMRLETTTYMTDALRLYEALGFRGTEPHYAIPERFIEITRFLELDLSS